MISRLYARALGVGATLAAAGPVWAAEPKPWQIDLPAPVTPIAEQMWVFHTYWLLPIITVITLFVLALLLYTCYRFRESRNPTPSKTTHNATLEVVWTLVPVLILVVIAFPSMKLLYATDRTEDADMTLKAIGHQWYWSYEYPDHGNFTFDAFLAARTAEEAEELGVRRLMDTDNLVVVPVDTKIRLIITASDVLHAWAISDFGVRMDAVPGRLNEAWFKATKTGTYYGFCSELCGTDHAFMPIAVKVVEQEEFEEWVAWAQENYFTLDSADARPATPAQPRLAAAEPR